MHLLWLLQRLSYYEPHREGQPADGPRFREGIREARKLLALVGYEPGEEAEADAKPGSNALAGLKDVARDGLELAELRAAAVKWGDYDGSKPLVEWFTYQLVDLKTTKEDRAEIERTHKTFAHWWHGIRSAEMDKWVRKHAPEDVRNTYFCIWANGCPGITERAQATEPERAEYEAMAMQLDAMARERAANYPNGYTYEIREAFHAISEFRNRPFHEMTRGECLHLMSRIQGVLSMMLPQNAGSTGYVEKLKAEIAELRMEKEPEIAPDGGTAAEVLDYVGRCACGWMPAARILGNARAGDFCRALKLALSALGTASESWTPEQRALARWCEDWQAQQELDARSELRK